MPKLSPRSIAYDRTRDRTVLLAAHGKDRYLLGLDAAMAVRVLRKVKPPSEHFWIDGDRAVFWAIDKTVVVPLEGDAKPTTIKHAGTLELAVAFAPEPPGLYGVLDRSVVRFDGDRWTTIDGDPSAPDARVVLATLKGADARRLGGTTWTTLVEHAVVRASVSTSGQRCLVGVHGGKHVVIGLDGSDPRPVALDTIWCSIGCDRGFFAWSSYKVFEVGHDGTAVDTGLVKDVEAADTCLFRAGDAVYFVQRSTIHRYRAGAWTQHDMAAAAAAIDLR